MLYGKEIIVILAGYTLGCFSTGYYFVRFRTGEDIRNLGSGSVGARNVGRTFGASGFVITLLGDLAKGAIAVGIAFYFGIEPWGVMLVMAAVVMGHIWPVQLGFRGGKGLATALGALLVFDYQLVIVLIMLAGLMLALVRRFTLSGLVVVALTPGVAAVMGRPRTSVFGITALVLLILFAHRTNIRVILERYVARQKRETKPPVYGLERNRVMESTSPLTFKIASAEWEFEQIHRLNYQAFVEEIPQHKPSPNKTLVDKFHKENTYIICLRDDQLLGMAAVRDKRPFSLDEKLENLDSYLPQVRSICEIRLLAVERDHRRGRILQELIARLVQYCESQGYDLAIASGTVRQMKLYKHLGCVPFGPLVGTPDARFQPMYLALEAIKEVQERSKGFSRSPPTPSVVQTYVNLLPGPVGISREVRQVFGDVPVSHRSDRFVEDFQHTKRLLCQLVGSRYVEILMGSGTLVNDATAAQLSLNSRHGLILSNGEFGNRLIDHATRFGLSFETLQVDWGATFDRDNIKHIIDRNPKIEWLWAVHCETSTDVLNDMAMLKEVCAEREIRLCMDCVSSIGTVPVDLRGVYLASGVSGKGLGALPGLSMVFYNHKILPAPKTLPRYLDLGLYAAYNGIPFTISSNLLYALKTALECFQSQSTRPFNDIVDLSVWLRSRLRELGFHILTPDAHASPAVITIALPSPMSSERVGHRLEEAGYLLSYKSEYLLKRNWIQICLMGECSQEMITPLLNVLEELCHPRRRAP